MRSESLELTIECEERNDLARLEAHLRIRLRDYVYDFRIGIRDEGLILDGRARTYYGKQLAQHGVMEQSPLPIRANNIIVQ
jgi:hypothetical protein